MAVKIDMPLAANFGNEPLLLDASAGFAIIVEEGAGYRWVERYAQKKDQYTPLPIGTESTVRPGYYLTKEQNFRDVGGGFFEWDRLYANVPTAWSETQSLVLTYVAERTVITIGGEEPGIETFQTNRSAQVSTKVTHTYQVGYPDTAAATSLSDPIYADGASIPVDTVVRPQDVERYLGDIWEIRTYTLLKAFNA